MKFSNTGMEENLANEIRMTPRMSNFLNTKNTFQEETVSCIKCSSQVNKNRDVTIRYSCAKIIGDLDNSSEELQEWKLDYSMFKGEWKERK